MAQAKETVGKPWLKFYDEGVPETVEYDDTTLPEYMELSVAQFPENTALIFQGFAVSYRELKDMVDRFATALSNFGVKKGDSVAILLPNVIPC
ncbi:MAG: AMP-binding protein, partial [Proteobacteria bacterium]|nr:AMP-binding protein [Pseudomonadota bacterium]